MEIVLTILIMLLFGMFIVLRDKTVRLDREAGMLRQQVGGQTTELSSMREFMEHEFSTVWQSIAAGTVNRPVPATAGPRPRRRIRQAETTAPDVRRQTRVERVPDPDEEPLADPVPTTATRPRTPQAPSPLQQWFQKLRTTEEWEALIGGRLMNRIGAVALILGMAFFFKYAVDQNWISQGLRVCAGLVAGLGLLGLAWRSHQRGYAIFAQGLVGAGQAALYLSVYASFNFYHLVPQPVALAGMGVVTALGFAQAVRYDSLAVSLLACTGGYLTPFLLASGGSPAGTIAYVLLLDLGTLALFVRNPQWTVLEPTALVATYAIYFSWYAESYHSNQLTPAAIGLSLFWMLFLLFDVYRSFTTKGTASRVQHALGFLNGAAYYTGLFALLGSEQRLRMSVATLAVAGVYLAALMVLRSRGKLTVAIAARYALSAIVLSVAATAIQFRGFTVVILWSLEALPIVWYGTRRNLWYLWRPALVLYALALGLLFATPGVLAYAPIADYLPLFNPRAAAFLVLAGALACSAVFFGGLKQGRSAQLALVLHAVWIALGVVLVAAETSDLFRRLAIGVPADTHAALYFARPLAVATVWMAFSLVLGRYGLRKRVLPWYAGALTAAGLAVALAAFTGIAFAPIGRFIPVLNVRVAVFLALIAALGAHLRWLSRDGDAFPWLSPPRTILQVTILSLGFELVSAEINDFFLHRMGHPLPNMNTDSAFVELTILAAVWMLYSLIPAWYGVKRRSIPLIAVALSMAAAATGVAAFAGVGLVTFDQFGLVLGMRPVLLTIVVGGLLLQLRWLRATTSSYSWVGTVLAAMQAVIILLGFGLISAETRDAFARRIAASGTAGGLLDLERLTYSMVWLAYAILVMGLGIWRRARWMRLGAMVLLAGVILKVFIYDLSFLGAVYRPISFAGLGVILLGVSFLYQRYRALLFNPS